MDGIVDSGSGFVAAGCHLISLIIIYIYRVFFCGGYVVGDILS